jgi:hypothetical protein
MQNPEPMGRHDMLTFSDFPIKSYDFKNDLSLDIKKICVNLHTCTAVQG